MTSYITIGIILFMALVEITPVKINPISWLGKHFNKDISNKVDNLKNDIDKLSYTTDMIDIDALRSRILDADMMIRKGDHLTFDRYQSIFKDITKWEKYHDKYENLNGIINVSIENIKEAYKKEKFN